MFEETRLLGATERSIVVQTRTGKNVKNLVELEPGPRYLRRYRAILDKFGKHCVERKPPTGVYNCAGHVWASRRTAILESDQWQLILLEDGYRRLSPGREPFPGDLALYRDSDTDDVLHVAEVLRLSPGIGPETPRKPWLLSKLDSTAGEVMHYESDLVKYYTDLGFQVAVDYWTDRPPEGVDR
jgi:hypothetical protein